MRNIICFSLLAFLLLLPSDNYGREAGWVPMPNEAWSPPASTSSYSRPVKKKSPRALQPFTPGATVYDRQPSVTEAELDQFLTLLPQFRQWTHKNQENAHPVINKLGQPDFMYSQKAASWVKAHGIEPVRFFCIMGRMAAALAIIEEGNDLPASRPRDMPAVAQDEISLVRKHLGELLSAATRPVAN